MKKTLGRILLLLTAAALLRCGINKPLTVGYVVSGPAPTVEDVAAMNWLSQRPGLKPVTVRPGENLKADVYWIHLPDSAAYAVWQASDGPVWFARMGRQSAFLLTDFAALLPNDAGFEPQRPEVRTEAITDDWLFDQKGLQSRGGHPVFRGFEGGAFIWDAFEDHALTTIGYFGNAYPDSGQVIGVEKAYVTIYSDRKLMVDQWPGQGHLVSVGGLIHLTARNRLDLHQRLFLDNALRFAASSRYKPRHGWAWKPFDMTPVAFKPTVFRVKPSSVRDMETVPESRLVIRQDTPGQGDYDLAGRRMLLMGREAGGIDEVWAHPFRIARDVQAGVVFADSIAWLRHCPATLDIRPESLTRVYETPVGRVRERLFPSQNEAGALIHYDLLARKDARLVLTLRSDLRWMWPYDEKALGPVHYGFDDRSGALHLKDESGLFYALLGADVKPESHVEGGYARLDWKDDAFTGETGAVQEIRHGAVYPLNADNGFGLNVALAGTNQGEWITRQTYQKLLTHPQDVYAETVDHVQTLLNQSVTLETPDPEFDDLWQWALVGTDRFWTTTYPLGTALVAGFSTTKRGWDGRHAVNGRPGYAWYFGRDAVWSGFAVDDYGDTEDVREQLDFFSRYQDVSGKIFHELSTSGVLHYDAADATPLYVILAAHYLRASGDAAFIQKLWPSLKSAMDFCYSTDTDGDGLIENTNVGHGWVEGGALWGAHTTFYLAGLWAQALTDAAELAQVAGEANLPDQYAADATAVKHQLNTVFWNAADRFSYYGKNADGSFNPEQTMLPAVVLYYGLLDADKAAPMLRTWAGNGYTTNWGVRILSGESPRFHPISYHGGSVWPLFTGWTALAEYAYDRPVQGFGHLYDNLIVKNHWSLGFVEEVLNGSTYAPSGVCPHQCWSETNILHPGIVGMIGWKPDALRHAAALTPRFPAQWDSVTVRHLRVGDSRLSLTLRRMAKETEYVLGLESGDPVEVTLSPERWDGMTWEAVRVDDAPKPLDETVTLTVQKTRHVRVFHRGGLALAPVMSRPEPGDGPVGPRIVDTQFQNGRYTLTLEGPSGGQAVFPCRVRDGRIVKAQNAVPVPSEKGMGWIDLQVDFPASDKPYTVRRVILDYHPGEAHDKTIP